MRLSASAMRLTDYTAMRTHSQQTRFRAQAARLRVRTFVGILLLLAGGIAQAWHTHSDEMLRPRHTNTVSAPDSADGCPLCVAMHSASPADAIADQPMPVRYIAMAAAAERVAVSAPQGFHHTSRPPPLV
jgi:hypothetical protein